MDNELSISKDISDKMQLDLSRTTPLDFSFNINESEASGWYKEEHERILARESWLAGLDLNVRICNG